ncbi:MAG: hypothetical protein QOD66_2597 [Solirubrobacteraceae bacterium]|jgi:cobalamin biosynthesis Mg chelatase CobN|nr:hypothetical protein [Solirubrobacteraceae bacterium]
MRYVLRALLAASLGLVVALLVACGGGSGLLSSGQANSLNTQLDQVSSAVGSGQCSTASNAASGFTNAVDNLSGQGVSPKLVANLQQAATLVSQLATRQCTQSTTTTSSSTTSSPTTTTTTTTSSPTTTSSSTSTTPSSSSSVTSSTPSSTSSTSGSGGAGLGGGGSGGGGVVGNGQ